MNAGELIKQAYIKIGKTAALGGVGGEDTETAINYLNDLMYSVDYMGLGYTEVVSASDDITTPAYSWKWMKNKLALELAPEFGQLESYAAIDRLAEEGWSTILISNSRIGPPSMHGNVPLGSGNKMPGGCYSNFYPESDDGILTETNQEIVVEDDT